MSAPVCSSTSQHAERSIWYSVLDRMNLQLDEAPAKIALIISPSEEVVIDYHGIAASLLPPLEHLPDGVVLQPDKVRVLVHLLVILVHQL